MAASQRRRGRTIPPHLYDDAVEAILTFLPPKESAKFSVMSQRFRYSWQSCRNLCFDRNFSKNYSRGDYINIVTNFFQHRLNNNIDVFKLFFDPTGVRELISFWLNKCVESGIQELELDFSLSPPDRIAVLRAHILGVETLKILRLVKVQLDISNFPPNYVSKLRELSIQRAKPNPATISLIFSTCLELQTFEIMKCSVISRLDIFAQNHKGFNMLVVKNCNDIRSIQLNAPTLRSLHYCGKICDFVFYCNLPRLEDVILEITRARNFHMFSHREDLVLAIRNVNNLTATSPFIEMLSMRFEDNHYMMLGFSFMNLKEFHLIVQSESYINPFDIAMFLQRCPRIERIFIDLKLNSFGSSTIWEFHARACLSQFNLIFPCMKSVKIKGFALKETHATMAKFFLKVAKFLERLVLVKARNHNFPELFPHESLRCETESHAKIEVYEHCRDMSDIVPKHLKHAS